MLIMPRSMTQTRWICRSGPRCRDDVLDGLQVLGVAGPGAMGQRKALAGEDQSQDDLLAIAAMVAGIAAAGQVVVLGQAFEVGAGQVVEQQIVIELEEGAEPFLQVGFDLVLSLEELVEGAIQTILGDGGVGHAEQVFQSGGAYQCSARANSLHGWQRRLMTSMATMSAGGTVSLPWGTWRSDDVIEAEELPEPASQPHIAEAAGIAPTDLAEADADDIGIVGQGDGLVLGKEANCWRRPGGCKRRRCVANAVPDRD